MNRLALVAIIVAARGAFAQPAPVDKPAAEELFEQGRAELAAGHPDAACKKFEQSLRKDPRAVGTLLNLGLCNERLGKLATALALFVEAFDRASEAALTEQRDAASQHVAALRPQVPIVAISYAAGALPGEKLLVDDRVIARDDSEQSLDPGPHSVVFTAPGRLPYETTLVTKASTRSSLALPVLTTGGAGSSPRRLAGKVLAFGGGGLVVTSVVIALVARHKYRAQFEGSSPHCGTAPPIDGREVCDDIGAQNIDTAQTYSTTATVIGALGVATAVAGVALWFTAPDREHRVVPVATASSAGLAVVGWF